MKEKKIFEKENKLIYLGLVMHNVFTRLDENLLSMILDLLNSEDESKLPQIRNYIKEDCVSDTLFYKEYKYLFDQYKNMILSFIFNIYVSLAIIKLKQPNMSYFEMMEYTRTKGITAKDITRKGVDWVSETGFIARYKYLNAGILLLLLNLVRQVIKENESKEDNSIIEIKKEYIMAQKIEKQFKPLTKEQFEDITTHFYIFKMDNTSGKCYYEIGDEKIYEDEI